MDSPSQSFPDAMEALNIACVHKPYISFKNLEVGEHQVHKFSYYNTKFGERVRIDLSRGFMILPERFTVMTEEHLEVLNKEAPKIMVYSGRGADGNCLQIKFRGGSD